MTIKSNHVVVSFFIFTVSTFFVQAEEQMHHSKHYGFDESSPVQKHKMKQHGHDKSNPVQQHKMKQHNGGHISHAGGHMGHGMVNPESKKFPSTGYSETKKIRPIERPTLPHMKGDPVKGKVLAYAQSKGRCLACHVMGADGSQAGDVGPNLSTYSKLGRTKAYTFQQIMDARAHNPKTVMPPFGTNDILSKHEVMHIMAYLETLKTAVAASVKPKRQERNFFVAGDDFSGADTYVEQGEVIFTKQAKNGKSCSTCHSIKKSKKNSLKGIAASYPKYDSHSKNIIGLEQRINICQKKYKDSKPYRLGSKPSNTLMSYVKFLSRNTIIKIATTNVNADAIKRGKASFYQKAGQLNFSCADCHTSVSGKWLRGQPLAAIEPNGKYSRTAATWPRHFIAGHDLGLISLRQRIRHCQTVTRTNPLKLHSQEYTDLELYITTLANGKPMLAPTMSKLRGE